jgi:hypothetical protein
VIGLVHGRLAEKGLYFLILAVCADEGYRHTKLPRTGTGVVPAAQTRAPRLAVIVTALKEAGLDGDRIAAQTQEQAIKDELTANTERAVVRGAFRAPTFFVDDQIYFGKDRLRDIEGAINATQ